MARKNKNRKKVVLIARVPRPRRLRVSDPQAAGSVEFFLKHLVAPDEYGPATMPEGARGTAIGSYVACEFIQSAKVTTTTGVLVNTWAVIPRSLSSTTTASFGTVESTDVTTAINLGSAGTVNLYPSVARGANSARLLGCAITFELTSPATTAGGEILLGTYSADTYPPGFATSDAVSYGTLVFEPNVVRLPLSSLMDKTVRVSGFPTTTAANDYVVSKQAAVSQEGWMMPFICLTNAGTANLSWVVRMFKYYEVLASDKDAEVNPIASVHNFMSPSALRRIEDNFEEACHILQSSPGPVSFIGEGEMDFSEEGGLIHPITRRGMRVSRPMMSKIDPYQNAESMDRPFR